METKGKKRAESSETSMDKVPMQVWFTMTLKSNKKVMNHHFEVLAAFFRDHGLSEEEPASEYDRVLKIFGF